MGQDERTGKLVAEAKALLAKDLRGGLAKLRQALAIDPDYPELEDEIFLREDAVEKLDNLLDYVVVLLKDRKDYQACQMLKELPANYIIEDREQLLGDLTERIARTEELLQRIGGMPKSGNPQVLELYEEAARLVPDYPGLQEELASVRGAFGRHQEYIEGINQAIGESNFAKAEELFRAFRGVYPDDISIGKIEVALRNRKTAAHAKRRLRKSMMTAGALVALVLLLAGGYLGYEAAAVRRAGSEWQRVSRLLEEKKFAEAQAGCRKVVAELSKVRLLSRARKVELLALVDGVRNSEMVRQGAAGRVAVDGVYVPGGDLAKVTGVKELQREAASLEEAGRPGEALVKYEQARQLAGELEPELAGRFAGEIEAAMLAASGRQVELLLGQARQLMQARDFAGARGRANEAANLSKQYGLRDSGLAAQIAAIYQSIDRARFDTLVAAGDKYLAAGGYEEALAAYDQALALIRGQKPAADHAEVLERIRVSMAEARVNIQAAKGDRSFQSRSWREAIDAYTTAIKLHQEGSLRKELPAYVRAVQNLDQARRQAALAELQLAEREARQYFAAGNWRKAKAAYTRVRSLAGQGGYLADREFAGIRDAAEASLVEVNERLLIGAKRDYLLERYRAILRKVFSLGGEVSFLDPEVVFLLEDEIGMKFSITARTYEKQKDRGKYTFYEAIYAFNRKSGEWSLLDRSTSSRESD